MLTAPLLRLDGDLFFNYEIRKRTFRIQVSLGCLSDVFESDGSISGDRDAFLENIEPILIVANSKAAHGFESPIKILSADFRLYHTAV